MIIAAISHCSSFLFSKFDLDGYGVCRIQHGNLLTGEGDILLCPVSKDFRPSNPLAQHIINKDKEIKTTLMNLKKTGWIGSEYVAFLPCRKYNCRKLSCPENFLYENFESEPCIEQLFSQVAKVVSQLQKEDQKIDFMIDIIIRTTFFNYLRFRSDKKYYDFSKTFLELLPKCSEILPWYRKRIRKIYRANALNNKDANNVRKILTAQNISMKKDYIKHLEIMKAALNFNNFFYGCSKKCLGTMI